MVMDNSSLAAELNVALDYFIERQRIVAGAMSDLGVDLDKVSRIGAFAWGYLKGMPSPSEHKEVPQEGFWTDQTDQKWKYFLHGKGCRLVNCETSEPIDWDCPDVSRCDPWKFSYHLEWQLNHFGNKYPLLSIWVNTNGRGLVDDLVMDLVEKGLISRDKF